jgi:hypothetical protein
MSQQDSQPSFEEEDEYIPELYDADQDPRGVSAKPAEEIRLGQDSADQAGRTQVTSEADTKPS